MGRGLLEQNPVIGTQVAPEQSRTRVLSIGAPAAVWRGCDDNAYGAIVKLLILTGQRREEIGGLRSGEICGDYDAIAPPPTRTKNKQAHLVPLSATAHAILAGQPAALRAFVFDPKGRAAPFTSWSRGKSLLDAALAQAGVKLKPWTVHDLRRSVATGMAELGVAPHIVEAVLNHASGHKAGVAGVYNRATYVPEKRAALVLWADHVMAAVESGTATVVPMRA
jgi:integrase